MLLSYSDIEKALRIILRDMLHTRRILHCRCHGAYPLVIVRVLCESSARYLGKAPAACTASSTARYSVVFAGIELRRLVALSFFCLYVYDARLAGDLRNFKHLYQLADIVTVHGSVIF